MKHLFTHSVWMASLVVSGSLLTAQAQTATQQPDQTQQNQAQQGSAQGGSAQGGSAQGGQYHHRHGMNPERETKMLTRQLGLSTDQASQVEPILAERAQKMAALKSASGTQTDSASLHEQRRAILQETKQKLDAVLTPAQQQQLAQMHHDHEKHGQGQQQTAPSTSPSL